MSEQPDRDGDRLSTRSKEILRLIALGHSHDQVVSSIEGITYYDVMFAAQEALDRDNRPRPTPIHPRLAEQERKQASLAKIRAVHPRAYEPWTSDEEAQLRKLHAEMADIAQISTRLGRGSGGVTSRLQKLGLIDG